MSISASHQAVHSKYHSIHIYDGFRLMNPILIIIHIHSVFKYHIFISIFTFVLSFQRYTQSMYLFHILIHVLISYTHSCTRFIYSFMYSFHILGKLPKILEIRIESENKPIIDSFFSFDTSTRLGCCLYPHLVKYKFFTLSD